MIDGYPPREYLPDIFWKFVTILFSYVITKVYSPVTVEQIQQLNTILCAQINKTVISEPYVIIPA